MPFAFIQSILAIATLIGGIAAIDYFFPSAKTFLHLPTFIIAMVLLSVAVLLAFIEAENSKKNEKSSDDNLAKKSLIARLFHKLAFHRAYNQQMIYAHRVFNIKGLRTRGTYMLELEQVFVDLRIAPSLNPNKNKSSLLGVKELEGNQSIWKFLAYSDQHNQRSVLAIIGAPGCGKTTLLQHIALTLAAKKHRKQEVRGYTPLLLFLRQHTQAILEGRLLGDIAQAYFASKDRYPDLNPPDKWFANQLQSGKCLVLLDGLDEVADAEQRKQVSEWIDKQIVDYPRCDFIVTSRPQGYQAAPLSQVNVLEVLPFTTKQVSQFIDGWYLANEIMSFGKNDAGVHQRAQQEAKDLWRRLQEKPALSELTVNPLLLTMIAMVHRYRGQLPGRRVELYAEICDVLLGHWREAKGIQDNLTAAQKRVALQPLAFEMMRLEMRDIVTEETLQLVREPLKEVGLNETAIASFLEDTQASSGLLLERESGVWNFAHLTFQEYLAAAFMVTQTYAEDVWPAWVATSWWHETLRLYAAQADATPLVQACLENGSVAALTLAVDCLDEALKLDATVREQVEQRLISGLESENAEEKRLAAEVKLKQRLNRLQRMDENTDIDLEFISCAEYQLFLDEMREEGRYVQPDHWVEYQFSKGQALQPIVGVRPTDAVAFCEWLSKKEGITYRLPVQEEVEQHGATKHFEVAAWYGKEEAYRLQWSSLQMRNQIENQCKILLEKTWIKNYTINYSLILNFDRALDRALDLALDRALAIAHVLYRKQAFSHIFSHNYALTHNFAPIRDFAGELDRARNLTRGFDLDRNLDRNLAHGLDLLDLALALTLDDSVYASINIYKFQAAYRELQSISVSSVREQRRINLLKILLELLMAKDFSTQRVAWRHYASYLAEYAVIGYDMLEQEGKQFIPWWQRWFKKRPNYSDEKQFMAELYAWLQIVIAREKGELPAWEGIRIVRDRR